MRIEAVDPRTVRVSELEDLTAANAVPVKEAVRAALPPTCVLLDLELSRLVSVDSSGLGSLIALHRTLRLRGGTVRLIRPTASLVQILELTRLHRLFEIVRQ